MKKIKEARSESTKEQMLLLFELEKEIGEDRVNRGNKNDKTFAWRIYKSFETMYSWIS